METIYNSAPDTILERNSLKRPTLRSLVTNIDLTCTDGTLPKDESSIDMNRTIAAKDYVGTLASWCLERNILTVCKGNQSRFEISQFLVGVNRSLPIITPAARSKCSDSRKRKGTTKSYGRQPFEHAILSKYSNARRQLSTPVEYVTTR